MRLVCLLFGCLLLASPATTLAQPAAPCPGVSVEVSRVHCLVRFVETLAGGNTYVPSRRAFEASRFNTPAALRYLRQRLPALRPYRLHPDRSFVLATPGPAGPLVLVCAHHPSQLAAAAELLKQQGRLDPGHPLTELK